MRHHGAGIVLQLVEIAMETITIDECGELFVWLEMNLEAFRTPRLVMLPPHREKGQTCHLLLVEFHSQLCEIALPFFIHPRARKGVDSASFSLPLTHEHIALWSSPCTFTCASSFMIFSIRNGSKSAGISSHLIPIDVVVRVWRDILPLNPATCAPRSKCPRPPLCACATTCCAA